MAPSKPNNHNKNDSTPYGWCVRRKESDISMADLYLAYRVNSAPCLSFRQCKRNPRCYWGIGEKKWVKGTDVSPDDEDEQINRNEGQLAGIANLGATCYVNSLLQLWFHNPILRPAIFKWKPNEVPLLENAEYKPSCPVSHLQAMFARMLLSKRSTIDPTQFTTSLELNTGEQQDAQEFSNLLMTLLDVLLERYQSNDIKNLIKDSFTGTYSYETICETCHFGSVRSCDFRELELMVKENLKDSLTDFLKEEILDNSNQYNCSQCLQPRDAKRRIKINKLPPVLNLQLMRFYYDRESQQKKKNKQQIRFPEVLDMNDYIEKNTTGSAASTSGNDDDNIYILNAVLNHKGRTANHGHYIAHIKDMNTGNWFECNDDSVQPMKSSSKTLVIKNESEANNNSTTSDEPKTKTKHYTSDGAYMLVYTRKSCMVEQTDNTIEIHDFLKNLVLEEDKVYEDEYLKNKTVKDNEVKRKEQRQEEINLLFRDILPKPVSNPNKENEKSENDPPAPEGSVDLNVTFITDNVSEPNSNTTPHSNSTNTNVDFIACSFLPQLCDLKIDPKIENKPIMCQHGKLKPPSPNDNSIPYRIIPAHFSEVIYNRYEYDHRLEGDDALCFECVRSNCKMLNDLAGLEEDYKTFLELTKETQKPKLNDGVWISTETNRGWKRRAKLQLENGDDEDISMVDADGSETSVNSELRCDHDSLSPSTTKIPISVRAWSIITKYFPLAIMWPQGTRECQTCKDISQSNSKVQEQNKEIANKQRTFLSDLYFNRHRPTPKDSRGNFYIVPAAFVQEWRQFIKDPTKSNYPMIQIESLLCDHQQLKYPVHIMTQLVENGVLEESRITLLTEREWNYLKDHISADQELKVVLRDPKGVSEDPDEDNIDYKCPLCPQCSVEWWSAQMLKVYIYENGNILIEKREDVGDSSPQDPQDCEDESWQTNGKREKREPVRRSKRTRMSKNVKKYTNINSNMRVRDFQKAHLFKDFKAILSDQHLYFKGKELTEKEKGLTFRELEIQSNTTLVLTVDPPNSSNGDLRDDEMEVDTKQPATVENGFRGTVLHGGV